MGRLLLLVGPSGSGKNTLIRLVLKKQKNISFLQSFTSRSKRVEEVDEEAYHFISRREFERKISSGEMVEWKKVHGSKYYGISKLQLQNIIQSTSLWIKDIEILGAFDFLMKFRDICVSCFIQVSSLREMHRRIVHRGLRGSVAKNFLDEGSRMERGRLELLYQNHFDFLVHNDNLREGVRELQNIIAQVRRLQVVPKSKYILLGVMFVLRDSGNVIMVQRNDDDKKHVDIVTNEWALPDEPLIDITNRLFRRLMYPWKVQMDDVQMDDISIYEENLENERILIVKIPDSIFSFSNYYESENFTLQQGFLHHVAHSRWISLYRSFLVLHGFINN